MVCNRRSYLGVMSCIILAFGLFSSACGGSSAPSKAPTAAPTAAPKAESGAKSVPATGRPAPTAPAAAQPKSQTGDLPPRDFPGGTVEWVCASEPGGSFDVTIGGVLKAIRDEGLSGVNHVVVYKPGGGSTVGWNYVKEKKGKAQTVTVMAPQILSNNILKKTDLRFSEFTPIRLLFDEYIALAVRPGLAVKDGAEFLAELKKDPKKFSIGIATAAGNHNHMAIAKAAKAAGVNVKEMRTVIFSTGGEAKTAVLGGHVDAISTSPATLAEFLDGGKVRLVAVSSPKPMDPPFDKIPTWKAQGVDISFSTWRPVMGPPGLSAQDAANWDKLIAATLKTKTWKEVAEKNQWVTADVGPAELKPFLENEEKVYTELLKEIGLAK